MLWKRQNEDDKKISEQARSLLVFTLTIPRLQCVSLLFCPLTWRELHFAPITLWLSNYILYPVLAFTAHSSDYPLWFFSFCITEGRPQYNRQKTIDPVTGLPDASLRLFLKQCKRKKTRSLHLCSSSPTRLRALILCNPPDSSRKGGCSSRPKPTALSHSAGRGVKPSFYFLQTLSLNFFFKFGFSGQKKPRF